MNIPEGEAGMARNEGEREIEGGLRERNCVWGR